jgi:hypothetical protein
MGVVKLSTAGIRNYSKTSDFLSGNLPLSLGAFDLLETTTLSTSASSVTFSGLGAYSDYKHLQIRAVTRTSRTAGTTDILRLQVNSDTGSNYAQHALMTNALAVFSFASSSATSVRIGNQTSNSDTANTYAAHVIDLLDFSSSTKNSTFRGFSGYSSAAPFLSLNSGLYNNTAAVTSVNFFNNYGDNFLAGTRFSLIGVK